MRIVLGVTSCLLSVWLTGCGAGRAATPRRGAVRVTIQWPVSRVIPPETRSIRLKAQVLEPDDGQITNELVVARPQNQAVSTATIPDVPSVKMRILVSAHANPDGSGPSLASGSREVRVPENGSVPVDIELTGISNPVHIQGGGAVGPCESASFSASPNVSVIVAGPGNPIITFGPEGETEIRVDIPVDALAGVFNVTVTSRTDPSNSATATYEVDSRIGAWITPGNTRRISINKEFDGSYSFSAVNFGGLDGRYVGQTSAVGTRADGAVITVSGGGSLVNCEFTLPDGQGVIPFSLQNAAFGP